MVRRNHKTVRCLLVRAIQIYQGDEETLRSGQGRLATAYRTCWERMGSDRLVPPGDGTVPSSIANPLETLAEVAHKQLPNHYVAGTDAGRDDTAISLDCGTAHSERTTTGQPQNPAPSEAVFNASAANDETMQPMWQAHSEAAPAQGTQTQCVPSSDTLSLPQYGFRSAEGPSLDAQWWPPIDCHSLHERTLDFQFHGGLAGVNQGTVADGPATADDWEKTVDGLYAFYGEGSG